MILSMTNYEIKAKLLSLLGLEDMYLYAITRFNINKRIRVI